MSNFALINLIVFANFGILLNEKKYGKVLIASVCNEVNFA